MLSKKMIYAGAALLVLTASVQAAFEEKPLFAFDADKNSQRSGKSKIVLGGERHFRYYDGASSLNYYKKNETKARSTGKKIELHDATVKKVGEEDLVMEEKVGDEAQNIYLISFNKVGTQKYRFPKVGMMTLRNYYFREIKKAIAKVDGHVMPDGGKRVKTDRPPPQKAVGCPFSQFSSGRWGPGVSFDDFEAEAEKYEAQELQSRARTNVKVDKSGGSSPEAGAGAPGSKWRLTAGRWTSFCQKCTTETGERTKATLTCETCNKTGRIEKPKEAEKRRLVVASPHRAQADEIGFHYAATMIGSFSAVALLAAYLYRRFLRSTKPEDHRF